MQASFIGSLVLVASRAGAELPQYAHNLAQCLLLLLIVTPLGPLRWFPPHTFGMHVLHGPLVAIC